jgi:hypothetical protein
MDTSNVDWVFVDGVPVVEHGASTADLSRARDLAVTAEREVLAATRRPVGAGAEQP